MDSGAPLTIAGTPRTPTGARYAPIRRPRGNPGRFARQKSGHAGAPVTCQAIFRAADDAFALFLTDVIHDFSWAQKRNECRRHRQARRWKEAA